MTLVVPGRKPSPRIPLVQIGSSSRQVTQLRRAISTEDASSPLLIFPMTRHPSNCNTRHVRKPTATLVREFDLSFSSRRVHEFAATKQRRVGRKLEREMNASSELKDAKH